MLQWHSFPHLKKPSAFLLCIRYVAIVHPMNAAVWCTRTRILLMVFGIWSFALAYQFPYLALFRTLALPNNRKSRRRQTALMSDFCHLNLFNSQFACMPKSLCCKECGLACLQMVRIRAHICHSDRSVGVNVQPDLSRPLALRRSFE